MPVDATPDPNAEQREYWNSPTGDKWVRNQGALDTLFVEITAALLDASRPTRTSSVLDIGCGAGDTTIAFAKRSGAVLGVDLSTSLLARCRARIEAARLANATVIEADAQTHPFPPDSFDRVVSRFGVMFFNDPVAAFTNVRRAMGAEGRITFACWAGLADNPWFDVPREAAIAQLGPVEPTPPRAPGPMAFEDPDYVTDILKQAGFAGITVDTCAMALHHPGPFEEAITLSTNVGPAARILRTHDGGEADVAAIQERIAAAYKPYRDGDALSIPATIHVVSARKPD
ncbi:class I SAM-dependent methyltransferase [Acuticoccus sediminis]|uniref:class I SAM-dependent methyltransferase n=1 Tax=Acuticoccus sediminis TaxID=2184697 RepID=UPI001CFD89CA|nr:class I SAM-dependent methyltransferase [Acuticoccus sediminis]